MTRIRWTSHAASRYEKQTDAIKEISESQDMLSYGEGVRGEHSEIETRGTVASRVLMNPKAPPPKVPTWTQWKRTLEQLSR
jgi:hypothetical protein